MLHKAFKDKVFPKLIKFKITKDLINLILQTI